MSAYHECDIASLVRYDPAAHPVLRWWLSIAVRRPRRLPVWVPDVVARCLYELAHPRGMIGRLLGRRMPRGPMRDPYGKSYIDQ